jgi:hypothetical protein
VVPWRPAPMTGGSRHGPRLYALAWTAQYCTSRPPAHTEPRAPIRSRVAAPIRPTILRAAILNTVRGNSNARQAVPWQLLRLLRKFVLRVRVTIVRYRFQGHGSPGRANLSGSRGLALLAYSKNAHFCPFR